MVRLEGVPPSARLAESAPAGRSREVWTEFKPARHPTGEPFRLAGAESDAFPLLAGEVELRAVLPGSGSEGIG
eukprot:scaffold27968_cov30-Tisochrysis_lutea.AAC.3